MVRRFAFSNNDATCLLGLPSASQVKATNPVSHDCSLMSYGDGTFPME